MATSAGVGMAKLRLYRGDEPIRRRGRWRPVHPLLAIRRGLDKQAAVEAARRQAVESRK